MKSLDIKGKPYVLVNERLKYFRENFKDWILDTDIISLENGVCVMKATIKNPEGVVIASGHAYEKENSTFINKTSYIENCETSAWGRALGNLGIGIDVSIATAEEVLTAAINQQEQKQKPTYNPKIVLFNKFKAKGLTKDQMNVFCQQHGISSSDDSSIQSFLRTGDIDKRIDDFLGSMEAENVG